jgi:hypothetical protein
MDRRQFLETWATVGVASNAGCIGASRERTGTNTATEPTPTDAATTDAPESDVDQRFSPWMRKHGGLHVFAQPGELVVEVAGGRRDEDVELLQVVLAGPDRQVHDRDTITVEDGLDSRPGESNRAVLRTQVERAGVYVVNVTAIDNQYGGSIVWSFRTNARRHVVETANRNFDDEPILIWDRDRSGEIWFDPDDGEFDIEITRLLTAEDIVLRDSTGEELRTLSPEDDAVSTTIAAADNGRENTPWGLEFPSARALIHVDGLTRWPNDDDPYREMCHWTTAPERWFPAERNRWAIRPYRRQLYGAAGTEDPQTYTVVNNAGEERTFDLELDRSGSSWQASLTQSRLQLDPYESRDVTLEFEYPDGQNETRETALVVTPRDGSDYTTYTSLAVSTERERAQTLSTPIDLQPYEHENAQYGYEPDYPTNWEKYVDLNNRPSVRVPGGIETVREGEWRRTDFAESVSTSVDAFEGTGFDLDRSNTKIAYDRDGDMYIVGQTGNRAALLHSSNGGRSFVAYDLGRRGAFDIEQFSGHNVPQRPPTILRSVRTGRDPDNHWRRFYDLELIPVEKRDDRLIVGDPLLLSETSIGVSGHSGVPSAVVSNDGIAHVIWGETTDPEEDVPGVPTYVQSYDREAGERLGSPELIGYGAPANDIHNRPSITIDSEGHLHGVTGTHGAPFQYARSETPNTAHDGWTEAESVGEDLSQTYVGLVCDADDTLHLVYRLWRDHVDPYPNSHGAVLAYQRKPPGESWSEPRHLVVAAFPGYSVFYHRLTIDRRNRLLLSYDYWSVFKFYRYDYPETAGHHRKTIVSSDGGDTWEFLYTEDVLN